MPWFTRPFPPAVRINRTAASNRPRPRSRPTIERLEDRTVPSAYEVWTIDQSNTRDENNNGMLTDSVDSGGTLYIYRGAELEGQAAARAKPTVIDLGGATRDFLVAQTGTAGIRPHMMFLNPTNSHAIISYVATGHVLFMDTATRTPVGAIDVGAQAHAAIPSPDGTYVIVADQNGKKIHRIRTDYATNTFAVDATLDLASGLTPSGALRQDALLRPDNAPICPVIDSSSQFVFATLRGGGLFVLDGKSPGLNIVAEYDMATVHPNGCVGAEANGKMYINAGGGTAANPLESDLYSFPMSGFSTTPNTTPNSPAPTVVFSRDSHSFPDSHGAVLTKQGRYLWVAERAENVMIVVDTTNDTVVNEFALAGPVSSDPAFDLMGISPNGNRVFAAMRGPNPLTGNAPGVNNAVGNSPGVAVLRVEQNGRHGVFQAIAPISHVLGGVERADPHALAIRTIGQSLVAETVGAGAEAIDAGQASPLLAKAAARWRSAAVAGTDAVEVRVTDLPDAQLGLALGNVIWLDHDAAGHGWFIDPTPWDDSEFWRAGDQGEQGHIDLLTVLAHELGHIWGFEHEDDGVMAESLGIGVRSLPGHPEVVLPVEGWTAADFAAFDVVWSLIDSDERRRGGAKK